MAGVSISPLIPRSSSSSSSCSIWGSLCLFSVAILFCALLSSCEAQSLLPQSAPDTQEFQPLAEVAESVEAKSAAAVVTSVAEENVKSNSEELSQANSGEPSSQSNSTSPQASATKSSELESAAWGKLVAKYINKGIKEMQKTLNEISSNNDAVQTAEEPISDLFSFFRSIIAYLSREKDPPSSPMEKMISADGIEEDKTWEKLHVSVSVLLVLVGGFAVGFAVKCCMALRKQQISSDDMAEDVSIPKFFLNEGSSSDASALPYSFLRTDPTLADISIAIGGMYDRLSPVNKV